MGVTIFWPAPLASGPVRARVVIPGSKSMTNRALILAALAEGESTISGALRSRDSNLMIQALRTMGVQITGERGNLADHATELRINPGARGATALRGGEVDCGLAGTVMRFLPPVAALAEGTVFFDGDAQARQRPISTILDALRSLGVQVDGNCLPFAVRGGSAVGGEVSLDASGSSQFVSGLMLAAARFARGMHIHHVGAPIPSQPHIDMTIEMLRLAGVRVDAAGTDWTVHPGPIRPTHWAIEPDLSNATPFIAAAMVTGGQVTIPGWPAVTTQPGDQFRYIVEAMGGRCELSEDGLTVTGPTGGVLRGISMDLHDIGELAPTVAALAAVATTRSHLAGIAHLRGHETDRLAALAQEINAIGGSVHETADGLVIEPAPLRGGLWHSYADHRMATAGAIIGLVVPGIEVENIATTSKTLPGFEHLWADMLRSE